jgi:hypothetical protein
MSLFYLKDFMKVTLVLLLMFSNSFAIANNTNVDEIGRSLANYQACSEESVDINDEQMFDYYKKMLNDISLNLLTLNTEQANQVYAIWDKSEKVLVNIEEQSLQNICLSRFGELSRKILTK